jgi:transcriptional regulator with XRE-family HTH domain
MADFGHRTRGLEASTIGRGEAGTKAHVSVSSDDPRMAVTPPGPSRRRRREAAARAAYLARRLGTGLRDARLAIGATQRELGASVGLSQQEISRLELGRGTDAGLDTWAACAASVGLRLASFLERAPGADLPRDMEHLRRQNLVIQGSTPGEWRSLPEALLPDGTPHPRSIDVYLVRERRREVAIVEVWDLILDGGAAMRGLEGKVATVRERLGADWNVQGLLLIRGTQRNRRLVAELRPLFAARYPALSSAWLRALMDPQSPLPKAGALAWTDVAGTRLIAARLHRA